MLIILLGLKKLNRTIRLNKSKNNFSKCYAEKYSKEIFVIDSEVKTNPWMYRFKDSKEEKLLASFYEKELSLSKLSINYYSDPHRHFGNKFKVASCY